MEHSSSMKHSVHVLPLGIYIGVGSTLFVLTGITVAVAHVHLGGVGNLVVAMAIATIKGSLVALFFMHLLYDNKFYATVFCVSLIMLTVFITFTMFDTLRRDGIYQQRATVIRTEAKMYEAIRQKAQSQHASGHSHSDGSGH